MFVSVCMCVCRDAVVGEGGGDDNENVAAAASVFPVSSTLIPPSRPAPPFVLVNLRRDLAASRAPKMKIAALFAGLLPWCSGQLWRTPGLRDRANGWRKRGGAHFHTAPRDARCALFNPRVLTSPGLSAQPHDTFPFCTTQRLGSN